LNEHEQRYATHDLELVAIVHALKMQSHYLLWRRFILMNDHCGLKYLFEQPRLNARQARWMALINVFDFEIKHINGKENKVVDMLIQIIQTIHLATTSGGESNIRQIIKTLLSEDEFFNLVREKLQQEPKEKRYEGYQLRDDNLLVYNKRLYVSDSTYLRQLILDEFHRRLYVGHPGYQKMVTTVRKQYYWPKMKQDIARYILKCLECQ
jgi:hypothetical protein